jgi:hypothetical protein
MSSIALLALAAVAGSASDCASTAACNRVGSEALSAGQFDAARQAFERQIDFAETALKDAGEGANAERLAAARQIALNNAGLAALRAGDCLRARAWLEVADAGHKATQANRRQLQQRCAQAFAGGPQTGEFWQYAGHGAWNSISIRSTGDETLRLDAFWMRIGRGPLQEYGPAAMGELEQVYLQVEGNAARGPFEGNDPDVECQLQLRYLPDGLEVSHTDDEHCRTGGAGAVLQGRFWHVGDAAPLSEDEDL